jgi:acyl-CoA thioester hydrolase
MCSWTVGRGSDGKRLRTVASGTEYAADVARRYSHRLRVRYLECDAQGVVFNAHYFGYFDVAFTEFWREAVGPYGEMVESGVDNVVAEARARYFAPARFDDLIDIRVWLIRLGTTGMTIRMDVVREEELLVEGEMRYVFVDVASKLKTPIPDDIRAGLEPYVEESTAEAEAAA